MRGLVLVSSAAMALLGAGAASAAQLVVNGDFSAGNSGFGTGYALTTMTPYKFNDGVHGIYTVEAASAIDGSSAYGDWYNIDTDPTGGDGNVYVADASTDANTTVWTETVAVKPNSAYTFSYYGAEVSNPCCSNALLEGSINGGVVGDLQTIASWGQESVTWNSGSATSAVLRIVDLDTDGTFNDFTMGDVSLVGPSAAPEPASWALMLVGFGGLGAMMRRRRAALDLAA